MAIKTVGLDDLIEWTEKLNVGITTLENAVFETAAVVSKAEWQSVIEERGHVLTGKMKKSVKADKTSRITKSGGKAIETYPRGKDHGTKDKPRKPIRNAEKAFILHYMDDHFVDEINKRIDQKTNDPIDEIYENWLNGKICK
ncbi:MAG: hypothetical protein RRY79_05035 [Clostridia bacterium]